MESNSSQPMESKDTKTNVLLLVGIGILLCCICLLVAGVGDYIFYTYSRDWTASTGLPDPFAAPMPPVTLSRPPATEIPTSTLKTLQETVIPEDNPLQQACDLQGKCNVPETLDPPAVPPAAGDSTTFWVGNLDTMDNFQVDATLHYITPHAYFWVENGVEFNQAELEKLADTFEEKIYPTNREFFGSEWTPGVDGDPHIYIVFARDLGSSVLGYFSMADEINPLVHEYSNGHEMFLFNADLARLDDESTYGLLAHEFQHMIHWAQDSNEETWVNEGFAELASLLNGYPQGGHDWLYISDTDVQLNDWPSGTNATLPHYGASFLYLAYFLDRFGEDATKALVKNQANNLESIDDTLQQIHAVDPATKLPINADDLFMDWAATNFLLDGSVGDGRYTYHNYSSAFSAGPTETISSCPQSPQDRQVHQYGVDYIEIDCRGDHTLKFTGSTVTKLVPENPYSGTHAFWSNKGDQSDMTLTREFDLTGVSGPVEISYRTWYDIEEGWDFLYLLVSEEGGPWKIITTPSGTAEDLSGNSHGWAYTGATGGWIEEKVDLSAYAGRKIRMRFEYVTDGAVYTEGFLLDDVRVDAIGYSTDFEKDNGGWEGAGFVRVENILPQTFRLALITYGETTTVQNIEVSADQTAEIPLSLKNGERAILVVTGITRFTRQDASYVFEIR